MAGKVTVSLPQSVWLDALDPLASGMAAELELPEPRYARRGRGGTYVYDGVTVEQAEGIADYIGSRGETLLGQGVEDRYDPIEKASRDCYRAAVKAAERIRAQIAGAS